MTYSARYARRVCVSLVAGVCCLLQISCLPGVKPREDLCTSWQQQNSKTGTCDGGTAVATGEADAGTADTGAKAGDSGEQPDCNEDDAAKLSQTMSSAGRDGVYEKIASCYAPCIQGSCSSGDVDKVAGCFETAKVQASCSECLIDDEIKQCVVTHCKPVCANATDGGATCAACLKSTCNVDVDVCFDF